MSDIQGFVSSSIERITFELDRLLPAESEEPERLHSAVRWSVFGGGKRIRPILVIASRTCFGAGIEQLIQTAAAFEMVHTYSLIHDDLPAMDDDKFRRGRETCHVKFGEATAILAGDLLETLAFKTIADDEMISPEQRLGLISELAAAAGSPRGMVAGQQFDLDSEGIEPTPELLQKIHSNKTGSLIRSAVRAGGMIAKAADKDIAALSEFGTHLGLLFQITDDLLDVTQTSSVLGKTAAKDVASEKATYPRLFGIEKTRDLAAEAYAGAMATLDQTTENTDLLRRIAEIILTRQT